MNGRTRRGQALEEEKKDEEEEEEDVDEEEGTQEGQCWSEHFASVFVGVAL